MASTIAGEEEHEGSRRKASWKDPEGRVISATTRVDAAALLGELHNQILAGRASFADLAAKHSDYSSARHGGDLAPAAVAPKSAHYIAVDSPSARLRQLLRRAIDVGGRRKPRANPYTVAYNRGAGTLVRVDGGSSASPTSARRRVDGLQVHLQAHAHGRGGRVPGGGDHAPRGAAPKHRHPQRRPRRRGRRAPRHGALQGRRAFRQGRLAGPLHRACRRRPHPHGRTIVEVLQMCHRNGVIHRDLTPENFLYANK